MDLTKELLTETLINKGQGQGLDPTLRDRVVNSIYARAEVITQRTVQVGKRGGANWDKALDDLLTSRWFGFPIMLSLLAIIFWLTVAGANVPSGMLADMFSYLERKLVTIFVALEAPWWLQGILVEGVFRTLGWVVAVMLPPMMIFFPLFTMLEDFGYLPRVAFNVDRLFQKAGTHGKQALTMSMGFGCNAAGVVSTRIIESPRERLIATVTNSFVPCNGRFPLLITLSMIFMGGLVAPTLDSLVATGTVVGLVVFGISMTLLVSWVLSKTMLKGVSSSFILELPPYRKPNFWRIIVRSIQERTLFVLGRAVVIAAPAGAVIWLAANITIGGTTILNHAANFFQPFGQLLGMDGFIIMAFLLGLPANEIVLPLIIMSYLSSGALIELDSLEALRNLLVANGWSWITALNVMIFSLLHFPCGTTLWTIKKETGSLKWSVVAFLIPTLAGIVITFLIAQGARVLGVL